MGLLLRDCFSLPDWFLLSSFFAPIPLQMSHYWKHFLFVVPEGGTNLENSFDGFLDHNYIFLLHWSAFHDRGSCQFLWWSFATFLITCCDNYFFFRLEREMLEHDYIWCFLVYLSIYIVFFLHMTFKRAQVLISFIAHTAEFHCNKGFVVCL